MLYDITLHISYSFGRSAASGRHILRVMPAEISGRQRLVAAGLDFQPRPEERIDRFDFFGNSAIDVAFRGSLSEIEISMQARVRRTVEPSTLDFSPKLGQLGEDLARYRGLEPASPHHFTDVSPRVSPDRAITRYAKALIKPDMTVIEAVKAVNLALYRDMRFDADATDVDTPPAEAFAHRHGVCQDFTHIMIAGLRAIGIPAGYVSGFLRTRPPEGKPRLEGADAMHAWVRAWCGTDMGWVEFDPTNGLIVGNDHIVVAVGRDYSDVSPVKGILKTTGSHTTDQTVDVIPLGEG